MNQCEEQIAESLRAEGWKVLRNGWPDFLCWRDDTADGKRKLMCVEVKNEDTGDTLREAQIMNHALLSGIGLPVYIARTPDVSQIDAAQSLEWYGTVAMERFEKHREKFEKLLADAEASYLRRRQEILDASCAKLDATFVMRKKDAEIVLKRFTEIEQLLSASKKDHEGLFGVEGKKKPEAAKTRREIALERTQPRLRRNNSRRAMRLPARSDHGHSRSAT